MRSWSTIEDDGNYIHPRPHLGGETGEPILAELARDDAGHVYGIVIPFRVLPRSARPVDALASGSEWEIRRVFVPIDCLAEALAMHPDDNVNDFYYVLRPGGELLDKRAAFSSVIGELPPEKDEAA